MAESLLHLSPNSIADCLDLPSSRPQFPWCADCGEMLIFQRSGGSCPNGHGRIYPARTAAEWRRYARYGWIMGLPEIVHLRKKGVLTGFHGFFGAYFVVDRPELQAVGLRKAKSTNAKYTFDVGKPADFERSHEGRFIVRQAIRKKDKESGEWRVIGWRPLVVEPVDEELRAKVEGAG